MQKNLDIQLRLNDDCFDVDIYEPESGDVQQYSFPYSPDEHPEFDATIGEEIYSWLRSMADEEGEASASKTDAKAPAPAEPGTQKYWVSFAVDGRYTAEVTAKDPADAQKKAELEYYDADFGELCDVVAYKAINCEGEDGSFVDY